MKVLCYYTLAVKTDRNILICFAPVAQLDRASGYGPEGHGFESSSARQNKVHPLGWTLFFYPISRRGFEKHSFPDRENCNLSVNGCKVRGRVGGVATERSRQMARTKNVRD